MNTIERFALFSFAVLMLVPAAAKADDGRSHWGWYQHDGSGNWHHNEWSTDDHRFHPRSGEDRRFDYLIQQGVRNGELSRSEVRDLREHEREVEQEEARDLADGHLSHQEKKQLEKDENGLYRDLDHQLHDGEHAGGGRRGWGWWW